MAKARVIEGLDPGLRFGDAASRTVAVRARELRDAAEGVLDLEDPERVHAARVASRRLRAVLEVYATCFPPREYAPLLAEVKALADGLGARRDPDVQLIALDKLATSLPPEDHAGVALLAAEIRAEREAGNATLAAALEHADTQELFGRLQLLAAGAAA